MNKKGFTLVELIAVIVLLAIIITISMSSISKVIKKNKLESYKDSALGIVKTAELYTIDLNETEDASGLYRFTYNSKLKYDGITVDTTKNMDGSIGNVYVKQTGEGYGRFYVDKKYCIIVNVDESVETSEISEEDCVGTYFALSNVRYIKDCTNGSTANASNHWIEIQAIKGEENVAKGKTVTVGDTVYKNSPTTDGNVSISAPFIDGGDGYKCAIVDLNLSYELDSIKIWHYFYGTRGYFENTVFVSHNGTDWKNIYEGYRTENSDGNIINNIGIKEFDNKYLPIKQEYDATWIRVFYHMNSKGTIFFANSNEVLNTDSASKQSVLNGIKKYKGPDGKYEFLLKYPGYSGYNRWKQSKLPQEENISDGDGNEVVTGYEPVNISWSNEAWGGLALSTAPDAYIDGSVGSRHYFYSLGVMQSSDNKLPAYGAQFTQASVELWLRVDNTSFQY